MTKKNWNRLSPLKKKKKLTSPQQIKSHSPNRPETNYNQDK